MSSSVTVESIPWLTGTRPVVIRPQPPFARAKKYCSIMSLGRPVSSHMSMLPIGAMITRFLIVSLLILIGEKSLS